MRIEERFARLVSATVPAFASGAVPTGMAVEWDAEAFFDEYDNLFPDAARASKRHAPDYASVPAAIFTRVLPNAITIGEISVDIFEADIDQDFNAASTSDGRAVLYSGIPKGLDLGPAHRHINELAARVGPSHHLGAHLTPGGKWRIGDHHLGRFPSSTAIGDPELLRVVHGTWSRYFSRWRSLPPSWNPWGR